MIYTGCFSNIVKYKNFTPMRTISIARSMPKFAAPYVGGVDWALAPTWDMLQEYKQGALSIDEYTEQFNRQLSTLQSWDIADRHNGCILLCWEQPNEFCHRHLVSKWLRDSGYKCEEYGGEYAVED